MKQIELKKLVLEALNEDRLEGEVYNVNPKKGEIVAFLSGKNSEKFTKFATKYKELEAQAEAIAELKRQFAEKKATYDQQFEEHKADLKVSIENIFDAAEVVNTLKVETVSAIYTLSKKTEANEDKWVEKTKIDYQKAWDALYAWMADNQKGLVATLDKIKGEAVEVEKELKKGAERKLMPIKFKENKEIVKEGFFDSLFTSIKTITGNLVNSIKEWGAAGTGKLKKIEQYINSLPVPATTEAKQPSPFNNLVKEIVSIIKQEIKPIIIAEYKSVLKEAEDKGKGDKTTEQVIKQTEKDNKVKVDKKKVVFDQPFKDKFVQDTKVRFTPVNSKEELTGRIVSVCDDYCEICDDTEKRLTHKLTSTSGIKKIKEKVQERKEKKQKPVSENLTQHNTLTGKKEPLAFDKSSPTSLDDKIDTIYYLTKEKNKCISDFDTKIKSNIDPAQKKVLEKAHEEKLKELEDKIKKAEKELDAVAKEYGI